MGSPEKPIDLEMGDMDETNRLNPDVDVKGAENGKEDRFTGLKKDELLELSSQRVWVVSRWILFIIFWIVWVAMLAGAIAIVVVAPRCKAEPTPPWYQDTTIYELDVEKFGEGIKGVEDHLEYVRFIQSKTIILVNSYDTADLGEVKGGKQSEFESLVSAATNSDKDKDVKVVVDLPIDSLSTMSNEFKWSANRSCVTAATTPYCSLFQWRDNSTGPDDENWVYENTRGQQFKATTADGTAAYVNYGNPQATDYLTGVVKKWVGYGADGFQLRDFSMVGSNKVERDDLVKSLFSAFEDTQSDAENKKVIGLFLHSSNADAQAALYPEDKAQNSSAAVVINTGLYGLQSATEIKDAISKWRNATEPFTCSYAFNKMSEQPLAEKFGKDLAAGYTLLSYALPGVPYARSGDEVVLTDDRIVWIEDKELKISRPQNASSVSLMAVSNVAGRRVNQYQSMKSLRWDHNEDSTFTFLATNSTEIVAFARKWDKKPVALTIFNPTDEAIWVVVAKGKYGTGQVLGYSASSMEGQSVTLSEAVKMDAGSTMILSVKE